MSLYLSRFSRHTLYQKMISTLSDKPTSICFDFIDHEGYFFSFQGHPPTRQHCWGCPHSLAQELFGSGWVLRHGYITSQRFWCLWKAKNKVCLKRCYEWDKKTWFFCNAFLDGMFYNASLAKRRKNIEVSWKFVLPSLSKLCLTTSMQRDQQQTFQIKRTKGLCSHWTRLQQILEAHLSVWDKRYKIDTF